MMRQCNASTKLRICRMEREYLKQRIVRTGHMRDKSLHGFGVAEAQVAKYRDELLRLEWEGVNIKSVLSGGYNVCRLFGL
jgi:hypothetical protein